MLESIETRLKVLTDENGKAVFATVGSALALSSLDDVSITRTPSVYVFQQSESPKPNRRDLGKPLQEVAINIGVLLVVTKRNDPTGEKGNKVLTELRKHLRDSLFGWQPPAPFQPLELGKSNLVKMKAGSIFWLDSFTTTYDAEAI